MIGTVKAGSPEHKRFLQEWLSPDQRPMCKNCQHVKYRDKPLNYKGQFTGCGLGGFETHKQPVVGMGMPTYLLAQRNRQFPAADKCAERHFAGEEK